MLVVKEPAIEGVDPVVVAQKVVMGVYSGVTTKQLDVLAMETAAGMATVHPGPVPGNHIAMTPVRLWCSCRPLSRVEYA